RISVNWKMPRGKQVPLVKDPEVGETVDTEEHVDNRRDDGEPEAPGPPGEEALPKVEGAVNPEKLAGNQQQEEKEFAIEPGAEPEGAKDNQQDRDRALVSSEEGDNRCHLRAGKVQRLNHVSSEAAGSEGNLRSKWAFTLQSGRNRHRNLRVIWRSSHPHPFLPWTFWRSQNRRFNG